MNSNNCNWHSDRNAGVICQRCERRICVECMYTASVGFHCPECVTPQSGNYSRRAFYRQQSNRTTYGADQAPITRVLIAINALAFLLTIFSGGSLASGGGDATINFGLVGYGRIRSGFFVDQVGIAEGEWWRIVTGGFLHAGVIHLAFNMFLLWMLGNQLERTMRPMNYISLYLGALSAGSFGVMLLDPLALTVGASGAVFGLMGATGVYQLRRGLSPWSNGIGSLLFINLIFTFLRPNISVGGHLGGLIGGAGIGWLIEELEKRKLPIFLKKIIPVFIVIFFISASIWASNYWYNPILG